MSYIIVAARTLGRVAVASGVALSSLDAGIGVMLAVPHLSGVVRRCSASVFTGRVGAAVGRSSVAALCCRVVLLLGPARAAVIAVGRFLASLASDCVAGARDALLGLGTSRAGPFRLGTGGGSV